MSLLQLRSPKFENGRIGIGDCNGHCVDIVAVHGLNENLKDAWTDPHTGTLWLRDLLPEALDVARVLTFGYEAHVTSFYGNGSADRIQQHAHTLVADLQADRSLEDCSKRPIVFICHGLGGILVKKALAYSSTRTSKNVDHLYSIFAATYAILFFGTPHQGTDKLAWMKASHGDNFAEDSTRPADSQLVSAVETDSETLQAITEQFSSLMKQFHIFFFWEEQRTGRGQRAGYVVDEASAAPIMDNTERAGIHATHAEMVRFSDQRSTSFRTVIEALCRYCRNAPPVISHRWEQALESLARARSSEAFELAGVAFDIHNNSRPFQFPRKISERPMNKHFRIPQVVSSVFTGREDVSRTIEDYFWKLEDEKCLRQQQRHIIHGVGGSGKTQFCCKFAQDHRERFWGIFWIDASSAETAEQSFSGIGRLGGMESTQSAGKHWLSNCEETWLLIINNADDPGLDLLSLFPEGDRGRILVTTRNPDFRIHGTAGSTEFKGLKQREAFVLLLKAAGTPKPWTALIEEKAREIAEALGRLALALVHAGALILQRVCNIQDYLDFYNQYRGRLGSRRGSEYLRRDDQYSVYATWEHSLSYLELQQTEASRDAIQLLSLVAHYHFEHIRVDIFTRAMSNRFTTGGSAQRCSLLRRFINGISARLQPPSLLPEFLRRDCKSFNHYRIRHALHELSLFSLISYDGKDDSFSLHPLVHSWARDRLGKGEQMLWARIALNVLAESILLPPNSEGEAHEEFRRDILIHLELCLHLSPIEIPDYDACFGGLKLPIALLFQHTWLFVIRQRTITAAKCGYVCLERGRFKQAAVLLSQVKDALIKSLGLDNDTTTRAMLALAAACWGLGRLEEAVALQQSVVDARIRRFGRDHAETLSAMNELGKSLWLNGQYKEALELQSLTLDRMKATLGPSHESTLAAMDNLGITYGSWQRFRESEVIHRQVMIAREKSLGPNHLETLVAMNNLAMALRDLDRLSEAKKLMIRVYEQRKTKIGKEHPYTLWALCNLCKILTDLGALEESETLMKPGSAAAKRSLGEDHLGVLMGVGELARIYARQGRLDEAADLTQQLVERLEQSRGAGHFDYLFALYKQAHLYEMRGKINEAIKVLELAEERTPIKLPPEHPFAQDITNYLRQLQARESQVCTSSLKKAYEGILIDGAERLGQNHQVLTESLRLRKTF